MMVFRSTAWPLSFMRRTSPRMASRLNPMCDRSSTTCCQGPMDSARRVIDTHLEPSIYLLR